MMSFDPQRKVSKNNLIGKPESFLAMPKQAIGFRIATPPPTFNNIGHKLFAITFKFKITFSPTSNYEFEMISVTEILDNKKPLAVWALKSINDTEIKAFEKELNTDLKNKNIPIDKEIQIEFNSNDVENEIKIEIDRFLLEG